jgi:uncharacterized GH25 family protein
MSNAHRAASLLGMLLCSRAPLILAHDFWLQPNEYWINSGALTGMTLQVGHGPFRQRSPIPSRRITQFQAIAPNGEILELKDRLRLGQAEEDGDLTFKDPGVYVLVFQTDDRAQIHLPAIRFNDYLKVEGLTPASEERSLTHRSETDGSERYSRCAKALVQVGLSEAASAGQVGKRVGLPLEIVPEANPYTVPRPAMFPVRVLYEGHPLAGALIKLTNLNDDATPLEVHLTDPEGRANFTMPHSGRWLLNVIWTKVLPRTEETDFETVFSSLSFGFSPEFHQ